MEDRVIPGVKLSDTIREIGLKIKEINSEIKYSDLYITLELENNEVSIDQDSEE